MCNKIKTIVVVCICFSVMLINSITINASENIYDGVYAVFLSAESVDMSKDAPMYITIENTTEGLYRITNVDVKNEIGTIINSKIAVDTLLLQTDTDTMDVQKTNVPNQTDSQGQYTFNQVNAQGFRYIIVGVETDRARVGKIYEKDSNICMYINQTEMPVQDTIDDLLGVTTTTTPTTTEDFVIDEGTSSSKEMTGQVTLRELDDDTKHRLWEISNELEMQKASTGTVNAIYTTIRIIIGVVLIGYAIALGISYILEIFCVSDDTIRPFSLLTFGRKWAAPYYDAKIMQDVKRSNGVTVVQLVIWVVALLIGGVLMLTIDWVTVGYTILEMLR